MHQKYARDGFVALSVSVDDLHNPNDPAEETRKRVLGFLQRKKATFTNVVLDEPPEKTFEKLGIKAVPCVYVFNRDNRFVLKLVEQKDAYTVVEKTVQELLKK
jgi:uncharacterized protein YkuJ